MRSMLCLLFSSLKAWMERKNSCLEASCLLISSWRLSISLILYLMISSTLSMS